MTEIHIPGRRLLAFAASTAIAFGACSAPTPDASTVRSTPKSEPTPTIPPVTFGRGKIEFMGKIGSQDAGGTYKMTDLDTGQICYEVIVYNTTQVATSISCPPMSSK